MFGYIVVNKPELKVKEVDMYRSYYCGLCRELKERAGIPGQLSLTFDLTFVSLLLTGLYEPPTRKGTTHCAVHPITRQEIRTNEAVQYAADMNLLLTYYKCKDDWQDEKNPLSAAYAAVLRRAERRIESRYPGKTKVLKELLREQTEVEESGSHDLDQVAGISGRIMAEVLAWKEDAWEGSLRRMGFFLGKFICLLDAYDDLEKDQKAHSYNLLSEVAGEKGFPQKVKQILTMMMAEACREFERLPILKNENLLRNILYSGVWTRYETITSKRDKEQEKKR